MMVPLPLQMCFHIVQVGKEQLTAIVELVKDDYVVLSLPKHGYALGFAATHDFNLQNQEGRSPLRQGQVVQARIACLPSPTTGVQQTKSLDNDFRMKQ